MIPGGGDVVLFVPCYCYAFVAFGYPWVGFGKGESKKQATTATGTKKPPLGLPTPQRGPDP